jgi:hypothetical protein
LVSDPPHWFWGLIALQLAMMPLVLSLADPVSVTVVEYCLVFVLGWVLFEPVLRNENCLDLGPADEPVALYPPKGHP